MEKENIFKILIAVCAVLAVAVIITTTGWVKSNQELRGFRSGDGELIGLEESFAVCEDTSEINKQNQCVERLSELSKLLAKYAEKLKEIEIPVQPAQ